MPFGNQNVFIVKGTIKHRLHWRVAPVQGKINLQIKIQTRFHGGGGTIIQGVPDDYSPWLAKHCQIAGTFHYDFRISRKILGQKTYFKVFVTIMSQFKLQITFTSDTCKFRIILKFCDILLRQMGMQIKNLESDWTKVVQKVRFSWGSDISAFKLVLQILGLDVGSTLMGITWVGREVLRSS